MQCINPCREIRHNALSALQRILLSLKLTADDERQWSAIFDEVLFPLILRLLKPEVYHSDPIGMSETRVHAATLVCKIFLRYLDQLSQWSGMLELWLKILDILDRMMNSGQGDSLVSSISRTLAWPLINQMIRRRPFPRASRISSLSWETAATSCLHAALLVRTQIPRKTQVRSDYGSKPGSDSTDSFRRSLTRSSRPTR